LGTTTTVSAERELMTGAVMVPPFPLDTGTPLGTIGQSGAFRSYDHLHLVVGSG
jgi:hypothetical protein